MGRLSLKIKIATLIVAIFAGIALGYYAYIKGQPKLDASQVVIAGLVRAGDVMFDDYRSYVRILNPKAELAVNFRGDRIAIISGNVFNEGEKNLDAVELKIILYDIKGTYLREEMRTPLRPDTGLRKPLRPLESCPFNVWMEAIPLSWDPRRIDIVLNGLRFTK